MPSLFPAPTQFNGTLLADDEGNVIEGGQATYDGSIAVTELDRKSVRKALPEGFELADRAGPTHPVIHMIGHQRSPMLIMQGEVMPAPDPGYQEMILLIPYVLKKTRQIFHTFVVRMFLNDPSAIYIGNTYYCYQKRFANLPENGSSAPGVTATKVRPYLESADAFASAVKKTGAWTSCSTGGGTVPGFTDLQTILSMPLLGVDMDDDGSPARVVCSYWQWSFGCAEVARASSEHEFLTPFARGLESWVGQPRSTPEGGVLLVRDVRWRLALPPPQCVF